MIISLSPILTWILLEGFFDFTQRNIPELIYAEQLYQITPTTPEVYLNQSTESTNNQTYQSLEQTTATIKTREISDEEIKSQLCDIPMEATFSYRYEIKSKKCGTVGARNDQICGRNMVVFGQANNTVYGNCDCAANLYDRTLIYHPATNQCYFIFEKGYCREGEWLTLDQESGKPMCKLNPCRKQVKRQRTDEFLYVNFKCVLLGASCDKSKVIRFVKGFISPRCSSNAPGTGAAIGAMQPVCSPGSYISMSGNCQSTWVW